MGTEKEVQKNGSKRTWTVYRGSAERKADDAGGTCRAAACDGQGGEPLGAGGFT